jgi:hypothetical protein
VQELNEKCKLLEKSLRILAQENHDLEHKTNYENRDNNENDSNDDEDEFYEVGKTKKIIFLLNCLARSLKYENRYR